VGYCHRLAVFVGKAVAMSQGPMTRGARAEGPAEFVADRLVHIVGIVAASVGVLVLIAIVALRSQWLELLPVAAYSFGLLAMLSFSAAYNLAVRSRHRELLRRLDHAGIFVMIAGTYTPFTVLGLSGSWAVHMTILVWSIAALGVTLKFLLPQRRFEGLLVALYLAFGWMGLIAAGPLSAALGPLILVLIGVGGLLYTLGVIFHAWQTLPYQNAIWHGFVLAAAAVHYGAVLRVVVSPA
jgi:hemolysin III